MSTVTVELFTSHLCANCAKVRSMVDKEIAQLGKSNFNVRYTDVVKSIDHAVALGVLTTPAIAIDGKLIFTGLPEADALRTALAEHVVADQ